ncbi:hypothetical protein DSO57_1009066 [Entomophthora muscae]|uniref:Uncharacterized protein n=1 Tax=Entomophthora muscae TaxID=34485 RepID=A0ACC2RLQ8_9FUNG|nr:hypothetical protein DSO57_1009066 [Entomophthora muscae]
MEATIANEVLEVEEEEQLPSTFNEAAQFMESLNKVIAHQDDVVSAAEQIDKLIALVEPYQQQPNLLDPYLKAMVETLIGTLREHIQNCNFTPSSQPKKFIFQHQLFRLLYHLAKIRGYKIVMNLF